MSFHVGFDSITTALIVRSHGPQFFISLMSHMTYTLAVHC